MKIHEVNHDIEGYRDRKRLGRGTGTGQGKTAGRGHKGHYAHNGKESLVFVGGQMPLYRRLPKRGFNNKFALKVGEVNLRELEANFENGDEVTPETLRAKALANYGYDVLKVLGDGELTKKLKISAHRFSATAREKIEKAGGTIIVLPGVKPVVKNTKRSTTKKKGK
jgi:large subunit ribosomal protein L15